MQIIVQLCLILYCLFNFSYVYFLLENLFLRKYIDKFFSTNCPSLDAFPLCWTFKSFKFFLVNRDARNSVAIFEALTCGRSSIRIKLCSTQVALTIFIDVCKSVFNGVSKTRFLLLSMPNAHSTFIRARLSR